MAYSVYQSTDFGAVMTTAVPSGESPGAGQEEPTAEATVLRMLLGAQLRRLREAAGISAEKAGYEIRASRSKISRMETGRVGFKLRDLEDLLTLYGVADEAQRARVTALAGRSREPEWWTQYHDILPDWFETYLGLESAATAIRSFETQFVPGLFQTEDYARAVTRLGHQTAAETEVERRVGLRLKRQDLLARASQPRIWAIMDEAVLRRPIGGTAVMRAQLQRLVDVAGMRRVTVQVEKSYRNLELAKEMTTTARAALEQARETRRLDGDRYIVGVSLASEDWRARAGEASAQANLLRADLSYLLAKGELDVATGVAPK